MERSRLKERAKRRKARQKNFLWVLLAAAVLVCAAGTYLWLHNGAGRNVPSSPGDSGVPSPTVQPGTVSPTATPSPSTEPSPSDNQPANGGESGQTGEPTPSAGSSAGSGEPVTLAFVGDVIFASTVETVLKQNGYDYPYQAVKELLAKPDLTVANLETPVGARGKAQSKEYTYLSPPDALPSFAAAGFDLVNLANNHVLDYGETALLDTLTNLDKTGIRHFGAGRNMEEAYQPVIVEQKGMKIAFVGFSRVVPEVSWYAAKGKPGVAGTYDYRVPVEAIKKARDQADFVVVLAHWGTERQDKANSNQRDLSHRYIDAGADLVVGSHPHVLQGFEQYKGKWVAYSLGNFIFTTNGVPQTWETMILEASIGKDRSISLHAVPLWTKYAKPEPMSETDGKNLFERLSRVSYSSRIDASGNIKPLR